MDSNSIDMRFSPTNFQVSNTTQQNYNLSVFNKIAHVVNTPGWWNQLLQRSALLTGNSTEMDQCYQSCVVNFYALSILMVGAERTIEILDILSRSSDYFFTIPNKDGEMLKLHFHHLLTGNAIYVQNLQQNFEVDVIKTKEFEGPLLDLFKKISRVAIGGVFDNSMYGYSENVINGLESEISRNAHLVSKDCSFLYHVAIINPNIELMKRAPSSLIVEVPARQYYHCFIVEQYYSQNENTDLLRFHQAWLGEYSLPDYYEKKEYGSSEKNCLSEQGRKEFFDNFRKMLMCGDVNFSQTPHHQSVCFDVKIEKMPPLATFRIKEGFFSGASLRYVTTKIDPSFIIKNINYFTGES